jgi:hypothetical protein
MDTVSPGSHLVEAPPAQLGVIDADTRVHGLLIQPAVTLQLCPKASVQFCKLHPPVALHA